MSTHRLFISQPTKDKTNEQIEAERKRAIEAAQNYVNAQLGVPEGECTLDESNSLNAMQPLRMTALKRAEHPFMPLSNQAHS